MAVTQKNPIFAAKLRMMEATVFNKTQLHILRMMSYMKTNEDLYELKNVLSDYYAKKVDAEIDELWEQGKITPATIEEWSNEHMRIAYQ